MNRLVALKICGCVLMLEAAVSVCFSQKPSATPSATASPNSKDTASEVGRLLQERDALQARAEDWQRDVDGLKPRLEQQAGIQKELEKAQAELSDLKKKGTPSAGETERISHLQQKIQELSEALTNDGTPKGLADEISTTEEKIRQAKAQITSLVAQLTGTLAPEQYFKRTISWIYAGLIGLVIVCFFGIAFRDEKVRGAIFTPESGIQFVTMFSLVIAIILFGISGILEGKELSALLGGLSGYILGRTNPSRPAGTAPPPNNPNPG